MARLVDTWERAGREQGTWYSSVQAELSLPCTAMEHTKMLKNCKEQRQGRELVQYL